LWLPRKSRRLLNTYYQNDRIDCACSPRHNKPDTSFTAWAISTGAIAYYRGTGDRKLLDAAFASSTTS